MTRYPFALFALGMLPVLASGCGGGNAGGSISEAGRSLRTTLTVNPQAACGAGTTFTYTVTNIGRSAILLGSSNAAVFDVEVDDAGGKRLWDYGLANVAPPAQTTLAPGQAQTFTVAWYSEDAQGMGLKPGTYTVKATLIPQTINGAAASASQLAALPAATASAMVSTSCGELFVSNQVVFSLVPAQAQADTKKFLHLENSASVSGANYEGLVTLKTNVSVEAAIAYLQKDPALHYAEPNYVTMGSGGTTGA